MTKPAPADPHSFLHGRRVAFVGKPGGVTRREAQQLVRAQGGIPVETAETADLIVVGADEQPLFEDQLLDEVARQAAAEGRLEIITETQLWQHLGWVESGVTLYTPAMLAELLAVPVATIRRWHRRGLIVPVREVHRLPYFDFQEVASARQLARLVAAGVAPAIIQRKLADLKRFLPEIARPLAQLSVIVEGKQLLLRQGEGLIEPSGQRRLDFDEAELRGSAAAMATVPLEPSTTAAAQQLAPAELAQLASQLDDEGQLEAAAELYRAALAAGGPHAELCFQLAELLYRMGDVTAARERYYMAVELNEDYVEARANLGCVLAETGQHELAVAAFEGALRYHADYADVHYHLARTLDELGRREEAEAHWQAFAQLASDSPWSAEAQQRLAGS